MKSCEIGARTGVWSGLKSEMVLIWTQVGNGLWNFRQLSSDRADLGPLTAYLDHCNVQCCKINQIVSHPRPMYVLLLDNSLSSLYVHWGHLLKDSQLVFRTDETAIPMNGSANIRTTPNFCKFWDCWFMKSRGSGRKTFNPYTASK